MPQASDEDRNVMRRWFGSISDDGPAKFLLARGWTEKAGMWSKPTSFYSPSIYEVKCLVFLRDEWDYNWKDALYQELPV